MSKRKGLIIAVIGSSEPSPEVERLAYEVGRELARRGAAIVCGGLQGVMKAACKGAKEEGGLTIGILPGPTDKDANPYVDIPIVTGMGYGRNIVVVRTGRAVIAIGGAYGTMSEIGHALGDDIPVIGLRTWSFSQNGKADTRMVQADSPVDAVDKAIAAAEAIRLRRLRRAPSTRSGQRQDKARSRR